MKVALAKCKDSWSEEAIRDALKSLLANLGGMKEFVKKGDRVLLKPNLVIPAKKTMGVTTHPLIIKVLIQEALAAGAGEVIIGENVGVGYNAREAFEVTGAKAVADELGIPIYDLGRESTKTFSFPNHSVIQKLDIAELPLNVDVLINIPVMKCHMHTTVSLALKNLKGCLPHRSMKRLHIGGVDEGISTLEQLIKPTLHIIDGTIGHEGMGPISGRPKQADCLVASESGLAADVVAAAIMDIDPDIVQHLKYAQKFYGGSLNYHDYEIVGEKLENLKTKFELPPTSFENAYGAHIVEKDACSGCASTVLAALSRLHNNDELDLVKDVTFVVGQSVKVPESGNREKVVLIGKCLQSEKEKGDLLIPGCPPPDWAIKGELYKLCGREEKEDFHRRRLAFYEDI